MLSFNNASKDNIEEYLQTYSSHTVWGDYINVVLISYNQRHAHNMADVIN